LIAEKYWLTKVAMAVPAGFCAAPAETVTDPTVDLPHAPDEGHPVHRHGPRLVAVFPVEHPDRLVLLLRRGRHHVQHRRQGQLPCSTADGIVAKPGPWSCWTSPPSWLAPMKKPVFAVARVVAMDWTAWLMARTADTPAVFVLANSSDPKWYIATAGAMTEFGSPAMPTMNNCPTRWASVMPAYTRAGHESAAAWAELA